MAGWFSLFAYGDSLDRLLLDEAAGLIETLLARNSTSRFFFIRYSEGGPHLRLRFQGDVESLRSQVQLLSPRYFATATRLQEVPYEPEYDRYGGRRGVEIAERHFSVASRVALKLVRQSRDNPPKRAGFAYRLMVIAASGFGLPEEAIGPFFASYARHALDGCSLPERGRRGAEAELENSFRGRESRLAHERKVLASWLQGGSGACEDEDDLRTWQSSLLASRRELEALQRDGELTVTSGRGGDGERWADDSLALHSILASYIHMTNNRLGLRLLEEAHLAYLASRAFGKSERA